MTSRRFSLALALVAIGAAAFAVAFRLSLTVLYRSVYHADSVVDAVASLPPWLRLIVPLAGAGIAGTIARVRATPAQGVSNVMEAVALGNVHLSLRATASRVASSWAAIAGGMSIGREGPLIAFGGALGAAVGESNLELLSFAVLGLAAALAAFVFKRVLASFENWFERHPAPQPWRAMIGGALVGAIAVWVPAVAGNGYEPLNAMLDRPMLLGAVCVLLAAKVIATSGAIASGVPGGIFTPMLLVGASLGTLWSHLVSMTTPFQASAGSYALVGMAATTAASIHAPLTAAVMIFELSGDYPIVLPLLVATAVSTSVSRRLGSESVYESELRRRGLGWDLTLEGRRMKVPPRGASAADE